MAVAINVPQALTGDFDSVALRAELPLRRHRQPQRFSRETPEVVSRSRRDHCLTDGMVTSPLRRVSGANPSDYLLSRNALRDVTLVGRVRRMNARRNENVDALASTFGSLLRPVLLGDVAAPFEIPLRARAARSPERDAHRAGPRREGPLECDVA